MKTAFAGKSEMTRTPLVICLCFLFWIFIASSFGCSSENSLSLGQFEGVSGVSISPDGKNLVFTGCGHKNYELCTIYRLDIDGKKMYRYLPRNNKEELLSPRYSPVSNRFVFSFIPIQDDDKRDYENSQIAAMNDDGSGFAILTKESGLKTQAALSYDEKQLAFFKSRMSRGGSPLIRKRNRAVGFDLYHINLENGKETRLTDFEYYGASNPYFTSDNQKILFAGDSPMRVPDSWRHSNPGLEEYKLDTAYRENLNKKYGENIIYRVPVDGSKFGRHLKPYFQIDSGSAMPVLLEDNSIIFKGNVGEVGYIYFFVRNPDGKLHEIKFKWPVPDWQIVAIHEMSASPNGKRMVALGYNQNTDQKSIQLHDLNAKTYIDVSLPKTCENIFIK